MGMQVTECTLEQLEPTLRQDIKRSLSEDEQIVTCLLCKELGILVNVYLITNARLVRAMAMMVPFTTRVSSPSIQSLLLTEVIGIHVQDVYATATSTGNTAISCQFDSKQRAQAFASNLQNAKDRLTSGSLQPRSPANRLRELGKLHSDGLITESEFHQKRQEIMKQL